MRALARATVVLSLAGAVACAGGGAREGSAAAATPAAAGRAAGEALFASGTSLGYRLEEGGREVGRTHSTFRVTDEGQLQVLTRVERVSDTGGRVQLEHATTFRRDLSPVRYKRLSSVSGRYELVFGGDSVEVIGDRGTRRVPKLTVRIPVIPADDPMMLALAIDDLRAARGSAAILDVFSPEDLSKEPWSVRVYADGAGATVVDVPGGKVVLDATGAIQRAELGARVWTRLPAAGTAPEVKYSPPLVYERPRGARFQDVPLRVAVTEGTLVGALSVPDDRALWPKGLAPAVVILSDRGDQDRFGFGEGTDRGTWELGDALAEHGFAVVRIDDRGVADSASAIEAADRTLGLAVGDATALVEAVQRQPAIDPERVYLLGFGTGGLVALHAAPRAAVAGVLLVGTPFRGIVAYLAGEEEKRGKVERAEAERRARLWVAALGDDPAASAAVDRERLRALRRERAFVLDLAQVDVARVLAEVKVPVGVFQGLKDFEVSWREDAEPLVEAARRAVGKDRVKLHAYDHTDHWMKAEAKTSSYERYADRARRLEPRFVADVLSWLGAQAKAGR